MRVVNLCGLVILGIAFAVVAPNMTMGQPGGGGKKGGFGGGDPNAIFDYLAKGRQFFLISETQMSRTSLTQFAQERGITNGQITRQQYLEFSDWRAKQGGGGGPGGIVFGGGGFGGNGGPADRMKGGGDSRQPPAPAAPPPSIDVLRERAEGEFKNRDRNGDGKLNREEMNDRLRGSLSTWDKNNDGLIDLHEYRDHFVARELERIDEQTARSGIADRIIEDINLDEKPVVFRIGGKAAAGLPSWFDQLDTDKDGQVAMYEWRKGNKAMEEFPNWDLNTDGFITVDEAIKQHAVIVRSNPKGSPGAFASSSEEGSGGGGRDRRFPGMGKGGSGSMEEGSQRPSSPWGGKGPGGFGKGFGKKPGGN